ncbi:MAG TPA: ATP-binding protein [Fimbriimonadaceae bacterium]|jgi:hypothetical protein|nr:ATP-binding protein [Fimbriimonadaceae bacterium]
MLLFDAVFHSTAGFLLDFRAFARRDDDLMVDLDGRVTAEKLQELLDIGSESAQLDYKQDCDLNETRDRVELAKDVGAMQVDGAYIVIGADSAGKVTGVSSTNPERDFDEARLRPILSKWIPAPLELLIGVHEVSGNKVVVIYIAPSEKGLCIFKADGQYADPNGKTQTIFRQGDVFVRDGTQSRRWQQPDIDRILAGITATEKEAWRAEFASDMQTILGQGQGAKALALGPSTTLTWRLDSDTFLQIVIEQLRASDPIPLRLLLDSLPAEAESLLRAGSLEEYGTLLDRIACLMILFIQLELDDLFERALRILQEIFDRTFDEHGNERQLNPGHSPTAAQLQVILRIFAIGSYAVRKKRWHLLPKLVVGYSGRAPDIGPDKFWTNWIRYVQTKAARLDLIDRKAADGQEIGLVSLVTSLIRSRSCLRPDVGESDEELDLILTSIIQFDALAMMAVLAYAPGDRDYPYFPHFGRYYSHRSEPVLSALVTDRDVRAAIHPGGDEELKKDLVRALNWAHESGVRYGGGGGLSDAALLRFLDA